MLRCLGIDQGRFKSEARATTPLTLASLMPTRVAYVVFVQRLSQTEVVWVNFQGVAQERPSGVGATHQGLTLHTSHPVDPAQATGPAATTAASGMPADVWNGEDAEALRELK